jgi:chemotaxis protein MotB
MSFKFNKHRRQEDNLDDWLMTYADMITLLLCFFAIFLAISVPEKSQFEKAREKVTEQFAGTDIMEGKFPTPVNSQTTTDDPQETAGTSDMPFDALPAIVGDFTAKDGVQVEQGERITTIELNSAAFFASGAAVLSDTGKTILNDLLVALKDDTMRGYTITVEGHTDDNPISTAQFPSNWELSTARAASVVRYFLSQGIDAQRLRAAGYADTFPKVSNRDYAGKPLPDNQAQNRRVLIKLERTDKIFQE